MKFSGKNFQAWGEFDLEVTGLAVLTGPSDTGKSALMRALRGLFYNDLSEAYIREGSSGLELTVDWEGDTIKVSRAVEESTKYEITKQGEATKKFAKLAGRRPEELRAFGVNDIRIGDTTLDPIFAIQNDTQFLLQGVSISELNNILGGFASTEKLEYGKREANLRIQQKNAEARTLATEIHDAEVRRAKFEEQAQAVEPIVVRLAELDTRIWGLEAQGAATAACVAVKRTLLPLRKLLRELKVPDTAPLDKLLQKAQAAYTALYAADALQHFTYYQMKIEEAVTSWREMKKFYFGVEAIRQITAVAKVRNQAAQLAALSFDETKISQALDGIKAVREATARLSSVTALRVAEAEVAAEIEGLNAEEKSLRAQAAEFADKLVVCPQCGERFTP